MSDLVTMDDPPVGETKGRRPKANPATQIKEADQAKARPRRQVDPNAPATNSRQGNKSMRATHEHVVRSTPEGVPMENDTHYFTLVPNRGRDIANYKRKEYSVVQGHELNNEEEVVMQIRKTVKDSRYLQGVQRIREYQNEGVDDELKDGVERTNSSAGQAETISQILDRADENNGDADDDDIQND